MYAMTRDSRRARGQAVACDLVRVVLRGVSVLSAMRHNEAMRGRLSEGFAGYLVTECATDDEAGYPFRGSREKYQWPVVRAACTSPESGGWGMHAGYGFLCSFPIDAPEVIAAGSFLSGDWPSWALRGEV